MSGERRLNLWQIVEETFMSRNTPEYWGYVPHVIDSLPPVLQQYAGLRRAAVALPGKRIHAPSTFGLLKRRMEAIVGEFRKDPGRRFCEVSGKHGPSWVDLGDGRIESVLQEICGFDPTIRLLPDLVANADVFLDVGANHGTFALFAASNMPAGSTVVAFEPQAHLAEVIGRTFRANQLAHATVMNVAISDSPGVVNLDCDGQNSGIVHLADRTAGEVSRDGGVDCVTLDDASLRLGIQGERWILKIDVEGHDLQALRGASKLLELHRPVLICEINRSALERFGASAEELLAFLRDAQYDRFIDVDECPADLSPEKVRIAEHAYNFIGLSTARHQDVLNRLLRKDHK